MQRVNSYGNRGTALEELLETANRQYRARGIAVVEKVPTAWVATRSRGAITGAYPQRPAVADFIGCLGARAVAVEAKETRLPRLPWSNIHQHQAAFLDDCQRLGALCGLVVMWTGPEQRCEVWSVPWSVVRELMAGQRKSLAWEPQSRYRVVGVDYLARLVELERAACPPSPAPPLPVPSPTVDGA